MKSLDKLEKLGVVVNEANLKEIKGGKRGNSWWNNFTNCMNSVGNIIEATSGAWR